MASDSLTAAVGLLAVAASEEVPLLIHAVTPDVRKLF